jgi:hypothetical protein
MERRCTALILLEDTFEWRLFRLTRTLIIAAWVQKWESKALALAIFESACSLSHPSGIWWTSRITSERQFRVGRTVCIDFIVYSPAMAEASRSLLRAFSTFCYAYRRANVRPVRSNGEKNGGIQSAGVSILQLPPPTKDYFEKTAKTIDSAYASHTCCQHIKTASRGHTLRSWCRLFSRLYPTR